MSAQPRHYEKTQTTCRYSTSWKTRTPLSLFSNKEPDTQAKTQIIEIEMTPTTPSISTSKSSMSFSNIPKRSMVASYCSAKATESVGINFSEQTSPVFQKHARCCVLVGAVANQARPGSRALTNPVTAREMEHMGGTSKNKKPASLGE